MAREFSRRDVLKGAGAAAVGLAFGVPLVGRTGPAFGLAGPDPATADRKRLVVVFLAGGNDGLNTVVPQGDVGGAARHSVYRKVRPSIAYDPGVLLTLDRNGDADRRMGFNPQLSAVHKMYQAGRVAVVQGVDYPKHSYSHFTSSDIWHSGEPGRAPSSGWLGRHLDRAGIGEGELRAVGLASELPLMLRGQRVNGAAIASIPATRFADGDNVDAKARHAGLMRYGAFGDDDPLRAAVGRIQGQTVGLVSSLQETPAPKTTQNATANLMITARALLERDLGVESVFLTQSGYDTHAAEVVNHEARLRDLDGAIEAFFLGTHHGESVGGIGPLDPRLASRTLVVVVSEFGRRIGENGGAGVAGTDHGAAAPVMLFGPPPGEGPGLGLVGGIFGDHPDMGTTLAPAENLTMTTDLRALYQTVLDGWFSDPDPLYPGGARVAGLFAAAPAVAASAGAVSTAAKSPSVASGGGASGGPGRSTGRATARPDAGVPASSDVGTATAAPSVADVSAVAGPEPADTARRVALLHGPQVPKGVQPVTALGAAALDGLALLMLVRTGGLAKVRAMLTGADASADDVADPS